MSKSERFKQWLSIFNIKADQYPHEVSLEPWKGFKTTEVLRFMTQVFEEPEKHLSGLADERIAQGIQLIIQPGCTDWATDCILEDNLPWTDRNRCIEAIVILFREFFAKRTSETHHQMSLAFLCKSLVFISSQQASFRLVAIQRVFLGDCSSFGSDVVLRDV